MPGVARFYGILSVHESNARGVILVQQGTTTYIPGQ